MQKIVLHISLGTNFLRSLTLLAETLMINLDPTKSIIKSFALALMLGLICSACVTDSEVFINESPTEDLDYSDAYDGATRSAEIYKDFESRFRITATYLSPSFRSAFSQRLKKVFTQGHPSLDEAGNKAGFFISIQSPNDKAINLSDTHLWTIFLETSDNRLDPVLVRRLNDKLRWNPFFHKVSKWSKEYLILFDTPSITPNNPEMVGKKSLKLNLANSDARIRMSW